MTTRHRLIITALSAAVVALAVALAWTLTRPTQPGATQPNATTLPPVPAPATPSFNESAGDAEGHDHAAEDRNEAAWRPVAETFARNFTNVSGGADKWRTRLIGNPRRPYVTTDVAKQLATVNIANVPRGRYDSCEPLKTSAYEAAVKVTYREGWALVLYLITDGTRWQVYAYDRWEQ